MKNLARVRASMQDRCLVASLEGEIDLSNAAEVAADLFRSIPTTARGVVVDLSDTQYIDSQGVRFLLELLERLEIRQQKSRLVVPIGSPLRKLFRIVSITATTAIAPSIQIAIEEINREIE